MVDLIQQPNVIGRENQGLNSQRVTEKTSVNVHAMASWLDLHLNRSDAEVLRDGFTLVFVIPFNFSDEPLFANNLKSAKENPDVLHQKIQMEVNLGCIEVPFDSPPLL